LARARDYLLSNLVSVPGIGTFLAGRRPAGIAQMALATIGFVLTMYWFGAFVRQWFRTGELPYDGGPQFRWGLIGTVVFGCAWLWGLVSGLQIRHAERTKSS
jgi:TM2 domain-containing membrane protein YozV